MLRKLMFATSLALLLPAVPHAQDEAPAAGREYSTQSAPGYALEAPGSYHAHPPHGFAVSSHWDRTYPPHVMPPYMGPGVQGAGVGWGVNPFATAPWPLSNVDIEVEAE